MAKAGEPLDTGAGSNRDSWQRYLREMWQKDELQRNPENDYSDQLSGKLDSVDEIMNLLKEEAGERQDEEQLLYDFGYSLGQTGMEQDIELEELRADSLALRALTDIKKSGSQVPNPQYVLKGMVDYMAETGEYSGIL